MTTQLQLINIIIIIILSLGYLKRTAKYTDHVRKGDLTSYRILLQVWSLLVTDFKIKIEDSNDNIKSKIKTGLVNEVIKLN